MIDLIKNIFGLGKDITEVESIENGEISREIKQKKGSDFFEKLFAQVEEAKKMDKKIPFKVFFLNEDKLVVKVRGLFAQLPLQQMAWQYPDLAYWKCIFPTLAGREFKCKIMEAERKENERFHIVVDAGSHVFREMELIENAEYTGIILQKTKEETLIDIGFHFEWKYGSLCGFLPLADLINPETVQSYEPSEKITIAYKGRDERGLQFAAVEAIDLAAEFVGKTVWVQIGKKDDTAPYFMVKGKYRADLPITKLIYPKKKKKIQRLRNKWQNGDIINCEVLDFKSKRGLIIKWIDDEPEEIDWSSDDMIDYIGRQVPVHVYWSDEDELLFFVENKYPATLTTRNRSNKKNELYEGEVITARICSIDLNNECFKIRWISSPGV
jgi:hypothetical protein